ncbi:MAG: Bax inhibitor-1/YccA family protein [Fibrobacter sp.]|nr:Bax inhibitor-1/YccA family protein [Fibrobacter sp.]
MFCKYCGHPHRDDAAFCTRCGKHLVEEEKVHTDRTFAVNSQGSTAIDPSALSSYSNPAFREGVFESMASTGKSMTIQGAINKTFILFAALLIGASISWHQGIAMWGNVAAFAIAGVVLALVVSFAPRTAPYLSIPYALVEGLCIGTLSNVLDTFYPGIADQAVLDTAIIAVTMLVFYKTGLIQVTDKFKSIVVGATIGVCLAQLAVFILGLCGIEIPYIYDGSWLSVIIGIVIVGVAAFNLALDFKFFQEGEDAHLPKYCEWYAGFGITVTLVWLYVSILRLLAILNDE